MHDILITTRHKKLKTQLDPESDKTQPQTLFKLMEMLHGNDSLIPSTVPNPIQPLIQSSSTQLPLAPTPSFMVFCYHLVFESRSHSLPCLVHTTLLPFTLHRVTSHRSTSARRPEVTRNRSPRSRTSRGGGWSRSPPRAAGSARSRWAALAAAAARRWRQWSGSASRSA